MGYVFDFHDAKAYERWYKNPQNQAVCDLENRLMVDMIEPMGGETLLDIGCGTGESVHPFLDLGLSVTGIDPSPYMLDIAINVFENRVDLYRGFAEDLPFEDNSFNYASIVTTLEFTENPQKALQEACRVAKDKIFIGVLNKFAIKGFQRRIKGIFSKTIYNQARFFSVWELKKMIRTIVGDIPIHWRTVNQLPVTNAGFTHNIEQSRIVQKCPFGAFVGISATLVPKFKTRPLAMRYRTKQQPV